MSAQQAPALGAPPDQDPAALGKSIAEKGSGHARGDEGADRPGKPKAAAVEQPKRELREKPKPKPLGSDFTTGQS